MVAAKALAIGLISGGFRTSPKSLLLTFCEGTKHLVTCSMKSVQVDLITTEAAADLGIDISAGTKAGKTK